MKRMVERGFTLIEIMIVVAIIALLAAIAIPNVLRARASANETAAIGNIRAILSSLEMYRSSNNAFPSNWTSMGAATPPFYPQPFQTMNTTIQGYSYVFNQGGASNYSVTAVPVTPGNTGSRQFFTSESGLIRHCLSNTTTVQVDVTSPTIDAAPKATCP